MELLATLQDTLLPHLAFVTGQRQNNLLGGLGLLVENRLGLTSITGLLAVVTPTSLSEGRLLALLVLGHFVSLVRLALAMIAVSLDDLGNVHLFFLFVCLLLVVVFVVVWVLCGRRGGSLCVWFGFGFGFDFFDFFFG